MTDPVKKAKPLNLRQIKGKIAAGTLTPTEQLAIENTGLKVQMVLNRGVAKLELSVANALRQGMQPYVEHGIKMRLGRKVGADGFWRKKVRALLKKKKSITNDEIWQHFKLNPPRDWDAAEYDGVPYFAGPEGKELKYKTLCNIAADERRILKAGKKNPD